MRIPDRGRLLAEIPAARRQPGGRRSVGAGPSLEGAALSAPRVVGVGEIRLATL
jgi:hypothetical protein